MENVPEGEQRLKLNFTTVVQNFISKYSQHCQSGLIPGMETLFLRAKGNPGLVYFASFVLRVVENKDIIEMINSANPCPQNCYQKNWSYFERQGGMINNIYFWFKDYTYILPEFAVFWLKKCASQMCPNFA